MRQISSLRSILNKNMPIVERKAGMTAQEIYDADLRDYDVREFMAKHDIAEDSDTYKTGRSAIHEYVTRKAGDVVMMPILRFINGHISVDYKYRNERLEEYYTVRPKARYDKSVEHLRGLTLADAELTTDNSKAYGYLKQFLENVDSRKSKNKGMWLVGSMGIGKTYLMGCFAGELRKRNIAFEFIGMNNFINELKAMMSEEDRNLEKRKEELKDRTPVLIIDDIGLEPPTRWNIQQLQDILHYRYDNDLPTFFSSNLTKGDYCQQLLTADKVERTVVERLYSKMLEPLSVEIGMSGRNRRKDN